MTGHLTGAGPTSPTRVVFGNDFVEVLARRGSSPFTLVTFNSIGSVADGSTFWAQKVADRLDLAAVGIMARSNHWFPGAAMGAAFDAIRRHLSGRVLLYGTSMGGYAALKWSGRIGADTVLAFSPQVTISPDELPANTYTQFFRPEWHRGMVVREEDLGGVAYVFYDEFFEEDRAHAELLPRSDRIRRISVNGARHNTGAVVIGTKTIGTMFDCGLARDEAGLRRTVRDAKRRSPVSLDGFCRHLLERRKYRWASQSHERALSIDRKGERRIRYALDLSLARERDGDSGEAECVIRNELASSPRSVDLLLGLAGILSRTGVDAEAVAYYEAAVAAGARWPGLYHGWAHALVRSGRGGEVAAAVRRGLEACPSEPSLRQLLADFDTSATLSSGAVPPLAPPPTFAEDQTMEQSMVTGPDGSVSPGSLPQGRLPAGENYLTMLQRLHLAFKPATYLEIGVHEGITLRLARCATIGVDPKFRFKQSPIADQPACSLFQTTSDAFFRQYSPTAIFGRPVDMAFLDGMHWFEFLLRDFTNVERCCRPNSIILLHDCMPVDAHVGRRLSGDMRLQNRSEYPDWWAGDVWKTLVILSRARPDLRLTVFDAAPTGLVAITRLDPTSTVLADRYYELVDELRDLTLDGGGRAELERVPVAETARYESEDALSSLFWL